MLFLRLSFSSLVKKWARINAKKGLADIIITPMLLGKARSPYGINVNGTAALNNPTML